MKKREKKALAFLMAAAMTVSGLSGFGAREAKADESDFVSVGQNVLLGKTAIASSVANNAGPELAVDGVKDQPQQWNSADMKGSAIRDDGSQTPQWILIDRGEDAQPADITSIKLWWNVKVWATEYQILTSDTSDLTANPADTEIPEEELAEWTTIAEVDREGSGAGNGWVTNTGDQDIADNAANTDTITASSNPALAEGAQALRYVLVYFTEVNPQAGGHNVNLREIEMFDDSVRVDTQAVLDTVTADDLSISDGKVVISSDLPETVTENVTLSVAGSDLENVIDNEGNVSGYNIGERTVTLIVKAQANAEEENYAKKNLTITVPDNSGNYPDGYFPSVEAAAQNAKPEVIPTLQEWYGYKDSFTLGGSSKIVYNDAKGVGLADVAANMQADLKEITGLDLAVEAGTSAGADDIYIESADDTYKVGEEGYLLVTDDSGLKIYAPSYTGALYGTITVEQILWLSDGTNTVPQGIARDYPAYEVRGVMLDVARTPYRIQQIEDYTKILLWYKMNEFHLHISDNDNANIGTAGDGKTDNHEGFHRLESDTFPSLTSGVKHAGIPEELVNADYYNNNADYQGNPEYTKEEWIELRDVCSSKGINMITEIDLPGHSLLYNDYADENPDNISWLEGGVRYTSGNIGTNGGDELLDLVGTNKDRALQFAKTLWNEYTSSDPSVNGGLSEPVIDSDVVHIGSDEYWDHGTAGIRDAFANFANEMRKVIQGNLGEDTKIRMWGAGSVMFSTAETVLEDVDLAENFQLDLWYHGYDNAKQRIEEGYEIVNCRDSYMYGNPGRSGRDVPNAEYLFNKWNPTMVEDNSPTPGTGSNPLLGEPNLLGAKTVIWGDQSQEGMIEKDVHQRVLRAVSIVSEKTWGGTEADDTFDQFELRAARLAEGPGTEIAMEVESASSLVLDYDFSNLSSDGKTVYDASGNGYNGTLSAAGTVSEDGYLTFDGSNMLTTELTTLSYPYTVSFDIRMDAEEGAANTTDSSIFSGYDGQIQAAGTKDGNLSANVNYFTRDFNYKIPTDGTSVNVTLVGTFQGTKLYVDGQLVTFLSQKADNDGVAPGNVQTMYSSVVLPLEKIGEGLHAEIADLQVYNRAMSAEEAAAYYNGDWADADYARTNVAQNAYAGGLSRAASRDGDSGTSYDNTNGRVRVAFKAIDGDAFTLKDDPAAQMDEASSDIYSYWIGNASNSSLTVDLGEIREISEVQIQWRYGGKGRDYDIEVSLDGEIWNTLKEVRGNQDFLATVTADEPTEARYVRMQGISSNSGSGYFIQEFLVYEKADKSDLISALEEAEKIIEENGLGFESEDIDAAELYNAAVQAKAARENGIISAADMQAALERLNAAISNYDPEPEPEPETVTVTFSSNGGSAVDAQKVEVGKTVVRPEDPEKEGYVFGGWYTDEACTEAYDFDAAVTDDMTLYAKWTEAEQPDPEDPDKPVDPDEPEDPDQPGGTDQPEDPDQPGDTDKPDDPQKPADTDKQEPSADTDKAVQSGDHAAVGAWLAVLILSGTAVSICAVRRRRG